MNFKKIKRELANRKKVQILEFERKELAIKYTAEVEKNDKKYKLFEKGIADTGAICNNFIEFRNFILLEEGLKKYIQVLQKNKIKYRSNYEN